MALLKDNIMGQEYRVEDGVVLWGHLEKRTEKLGWLASAASDKTVGHRLIQLVTVVCIELCMLTVDAGACASSMPGSSTWPKTIHSGLPASQNLASTPDLGQHA